MRNAHPRRTLQWPYASGPMVILGGWVFLMSEVSLYTLKPDPLTAEQGGGADALCSLRDFSTFYQIAAELLLIDNKCCMEPSM